MVELKFGPTTATSLARLTATAEL